jgi:pyruvate dehydrogenase E1 component alpha subunit
MELDKSTQIELYTSMLRVRLLEEKVVELYPVQEMKCPVHLCIGQEAVGSGVAAHLKSDDYLFSNHRGHGHYLVKGGDMRALVAEFYGRTTGCSKGKGGSMHVIDTTVGMLGTSAIVGGGIPMGVGAALASSIRGDGKIAAVFFGDGAFDEGVFYESYNFAALKKLPVIFVCENNFYATNSTQKARHAGSRIADSAAGFDSKGICVDGNDVEAVYDAATEAAERARSGKGPTLIEALTYRWKGHVGPGTDFQAGCRPEAELNAWMEKCPIKSYRAKLIETGIIDRAGDEEIRETISKEIDDAFDFAISSPLPTKADLMTDLFCE